MTTPQPRRPAGLLLLAALAMILALRGVWIGVDGSEGWWAVYFEGDGQASDVVIEPPRGHQMVPHAVVNPNGELQLPPGWTAAVPLRAGQTIRVDGAEAPLLALGRTFDSGPTRKLHELQTPDGAALAGLDLSRPWRQERARLDALAQSCGAGQPLIVGPTDAGTTLSWGSCSWSQPQADALLIASGDAWHNVVRVDDPFPRRLQVRPAAAVVGAVLSLLAAILLGLGVGPQGAVGTGVACLILSLVGAHLGAVGVVVSLTVGLLSTVARQLRKLGPAASTVLAASFCLGAGPTVFAGYSTVEGDGLREGSMSRAEALGLACPSAGPVTLMARAGEDMEWLAAEACVEGAIPPGGTLLMLGGTNDDYLWGLRTGGPLGRIAYLLAGLRSATAPQGWTAGTVDAFYDGAASRSAADIDRQLDAYRRAAACAQDAGGRMVLLHNYTLPDLIGGRSPERQRMAQARAEVVRAEGGAAEDLLEQVGDRATLAWFADYIHPTAVGHRNYADEACRLLNAP